MEFAKFIEWAFLGILSGCAIYGVQILAALSRSIHELNNKISIIIEKTAWHEKWLERHDDEIKIIKRGQDV